MSYKLRLSLIITILITLSFSLGVTVIIFRTYTAAIEREEKAAVDNCQMVKGLLGISIDGNDEITDSSLVKIMDRLKPKEDSSNAYFLYNEVKLLYSSGEDLESPDISKIRSGIKGNDDIYVYHVKEKRGIKSIVCSSSIMVEGKKYIFSFCKDTSHIIEMRSSMLKIYRNAFIGVVTITIIAIFIISTLMVRPLSKLKKATNEIAEGNLSYRSNIKRLDEIGDLSRNFDRMAESMEENVEKLEENAEEKDRFMGAFTHELKTPMTSIIGYSELLRTQELSDEDKENALNYIYSEAKRLENMSLKLLQLFVMDKDQLDLSKCRPKEIVEETVSHLRPTLEEAEIDITAKTEDGFAYLEPDLVKTLLINLIDNGRKAIEGPGHISVEQMVADEGVRFIVSDSGKGMPEDAIKKVTEAFYRVDKARSRAQGGAGLGLSIVSKIIELHHGDMEIHSELGKGTSIEVILRGGTEDEYEA